MLNISISEL